jgi:hypothetical protein
MKDGFLQLTSEEPPRPAQLTTGEDAAPSVFLHGVWLQLKQSRHIDGEAITLWRGILIVT